MRVVEQDEERTILCERFNSSDKRRKHFLTPLFRRQFLEARAVLHRQGEKIGDEGQVFRTGDKRAQLFKLLFDAVAVGELCSANEIVGDGIERRAFMLRGAEIPQLVEEILADSIFECRDKP